MPVFWLNDDDYRFPNPALAERGGVLAAGGDLSTGRLLSAYRQGIFPWYGPEEPILWWCPDPRFVLFPEKLKVAKSMRPYFNQRKFGLSFDTCFTAVMEACAQQERPGQRGTWITDEMLDGYTALHQAGYAHSVEVWSEGELAGGLYGVAIGQVFFGESMFARQSNASKFGFISLVRELRQRGFALIDCQQATPHLKSLGAESIPRRTFLRQVKTLAAQPGHHGYWADWLPAQSEQGG